MFDTYSFPVEGVDDAELLTQLGITPRRLYDHVNNMTLAAKAPQELFWRYKNRVRRCILAGDKGIGKTLMYLVAAEASGAERIIILCTKNAMLTQRKHLQRFFPDSSYVFVRGQAHQRRQAWATDTKYYIMTYASFLADMGVRALGKKDSGKLSNRIAPQWVNDYEYMICDEYHRVLRNRGSKFHQLMKALGTKGHLILSSGSAANKGPQSMWTALNTCDPKLWSSYWSYVNRSCYVEDGPFGKTISGVKNIVGWRQSVSHNTFHRKKDKKNYPPKTRQPLEVEMEPWQKKIHDSLTKQLLAELPSGDLLLAPNTLAATIKLRQFMICPKFFDPALGWGAGLEAIQEDVETSELRHFVVSTPFTGPIPLLKQFFQSVMGIPAHSLQGGMGPDEIEEAIAQWSQSGGALIQSIDFAESYELPAANIMYFLGYHHDPEKNGQAEDRINRDISVTPLPSDYYYVKHIGSYDEKVIEAMSMHADNVFNLLNRPVSEILNLWGDNA